jgi:glyoxylase-like metal-dependent hydrolase (beta-lactamase superfamily II)
MYGDTKKITEGIVLFQGKLSHNLLFEPIVSNSYLIDDRDEVIIFDTSCGKKVAKRVETYIQNRIETKGKWKKAILIAGHSHLDHANNFYLSDLIGAPDTSIFVHEQGFKKGKVMNEPRSFIENSIQDSLRYYNYYLSFPFPYNLLMYFPLAVHSLSPAMARKIFALLGSIPWSAPRDGFVKPTALRDVDKKNIEIGDLKMMGWEAGNKFILPTPGHSPCSVSLYWPDQKALFISDADWLGNPVFMSGSIRDSIASLNKMVELAKCGYLNILLPAHGAVKEGFEQIICHLRLRINLLESMRQEILDMYQNQDYEKDIIKLTNKLTREFPLFKILQIINYPKHVFFIHNIVAVCLREEGILN